MKSARSILVACACLLSAACPSASPASMTKIASVPGRILDATPHRVLYVTSTDVDIFSVDDGQTTTVPLPNGHRPGSSGRLIEGGALVAAAVDASPYNQLDEFRNGQLTQLGPLNSDTSIATAGNYAIWNNGTTLVRRDLSAGQNVTVTTDAGNINNDVASNGDVVYWTTSARAVWRWHDGTSVQLSQQPPGTWALWVVTDGIHAVYRVTAHTDACCDTELSSVAFSDGQDETLLDGQRTDGPIPSQDYRATNGWIAYTRSLNGDPLQVWTRDPQGSLAQISSDETSHALDTPDLSGLNPTGQVMYAVRNPQLRLYLAAAGEPPIEVAQDAGSGFWSDGHWYVTVDLYDGTPAGNIVGGELWRVDTDTAITAQPAHGVASRAADFGFTSTAQDAGYRCRLDQGDWEDNCSSPKNYEDLPEGPHTFAVESTDQATGETDPSPATADWIIDLTPPAPIDLIGPADGAATTTLHPTFAWNEPADATAVTYDVVVDGVARFTAATTFQWPPELAEGPHTWHVTATDEAGNQRTSATRTLTVDRTVPGAFSVSVKGVSRDPRPKISWTASTDTGGGLGGYDVRIDAQTVRVGADTTTFTPSSDLSDGTHTVTVTAVDRAGNRYEATARNVLVDTIAPSVLNLTAPADGAALATLRPRFSWTGGTDNGSGIRDHEVWIDGARAATLPADRSFTPASDLGQGRHTWRIVATDLAGNERASETRSFTVDTIAPAEFALTGPGDGAYVTDPRPVLSWETSADDGGVTSYEISIDGSRVATTTATTWRPPSDLAQGRRTWHVRALDAAGNGRDSAERSFLVDTVAPVPAFTITPSPALTDQEVTFDAGGSHDDVGPIVHYEWDLDGNGTYETDTGAAAVARRTYSDPATPSVSLRVTDAAGHIATLTRSQSVTPAPLPGPAGVSINRGARFTNDRDVTITAVWPAFATTMLVSNDGGFARATRRAVTPRFRWRLDSQGAERLAKTVYVRFLGGLVGNQTYTDDIILDTLAPVVSSATIERAATVRRRGSSARSYVVNVKASDRVSGLAYMQLTVNRKKPRPKVPYARVMRLSTTLAPRWARVIDRAGNHSRWRELEAGD